MGQARQRGDYEARKAQAIERKAQERAAREAALAERKRKYEEELDWARAQAATRQNIPKPRPAVGGVSGSRMAFAALAAIAASGLIVDRE